MTLPTKILRWTPQRKLELVNAVRRGEIALPDALKRYGISAEEFADWKAGKVKALEVER